MQSIAVLGTGAVGRALATKLVALGHPTWMGARARGHEGAEAWAAEAGTLGHAGSFADAAAACDLALLCVAGQHAVAVVEACDGALDGKVLLDLTNPLDFSKGFPPTLFVSNDDSLGERIQRAAPAVRVVKSLNTLANELMVEPGLLPEPTDVFVAGDDDAAKAEVAALLRRFGHPEPIDMGGLDASRGLEAWLLLWTRLYGRLGTGRFNLKLVRADG